MNTLKASSAKCASETDITAAALECGLAQKMVAAYNKVIPFNRDERDPRDYVYTVHTSSAGKCTVWIKKLDPTGTRAHTTEIYFEFDAEAGALVARNEDDVHIVLLRGEEREVIYLS